MLFANCCVCLTQPGAPGGWSLTAGESRVSHTILTSKHAAVSELKCRYQHGLGNEQEK